MPITPLHRGYPRRLVTWAARVWAAWSLSRLAIPRFIARHHVALEETEGDWRHYRTLGDFFTRPLRSGVRPLDPRSDVVLSPCDGTLVACGAIVQETLIQAKGVSYRLDQLLADPGWSAHFEGGWYATLYLAPGDYHRVHAPCTGSVTAWTRIPGTLYPVNAAARRRVPALYIANERVVLLGRASFGPWALVLVGAYRAGSVRLSFPAAPPAPRHVRRVQRTVQEVPVTRGSEVARFAIGSTVIVLLPSAVVLAHTAPALDTRLRMGERLVQVGEERSPWA